MSSRGGQRRGASRSTATRGSGNAALLQAYGAGVATGLFVAFIAYLVTLPGQQSPAEESTARADSEQATLPQPSFDFYELLPQSDPEPDVTAVEPVQKPATTRARYLLQAGSFRDPEDADRRRAELLLLGLDPTIEESNSDNGRWYRVLLGPFESRSAMARARSLTAQQDIDTLLMRRQSDGA